MPFNSFVHFGFSHHLYYMLGSSGRRDTRARARQMDPRNARPNKVPPTQATGYRQVVAKMRARFAQRRAQTQNLIFPSGFTWSERAGAARSRLRSGVSRNLRPKVVAVIVVIVAVALHSSRVLPVRPLVYVAPLSPEWCHINSDLWRNTTAGPGDGRRCGILISSPCVRGAQPPGDDRAEMKYETKRGCNRKRSLNFINQHINKLCAQLLIFLYICVRGAAPPCVSSRVLLWFLPRLLRFKCFAFALH